MTTAAELASLPHDTQRGAVLTMGALHEGHAALMRRCRELIGADGLLCVSIFVNPTQFTDPRDLEKYPRTPEADLELCEANGVDVVFAPSVQEMYPTGVELPQCSAGALSAVLEGASRPGHFDAVATVVHRLLTLFDADVTCFGEKDYQQLMVVKQMVRESGLRVEVVGVPTVREADGLARSSRNVRLSEAGRASASVLPAALNTVARALQNGSTVAAAVAAGEAVVTAEPTVALDYLVVMPSDLHAAPDWHGEGRALIAAVVDGVRLIDNMEVAVA